ncbi:MAG: tRNA 2-thiouridine(34) synthase MnmA [Bacteroidales bacterium]|jgi:tRNA-specific 2-thiouridylase|nr:tRNA 2-thiouridine(34) synthase MnmA [Bacteroidales bacterium]
MMNKKVVIGLSGGVDSTVAALLLKQKGYDVIGLHFCFNNEKYSEKVTEVARRLDIPLEHWSIDDDFEKVKQHFAKEYLKGRTPSPCTFCNKHIKWKKLIDFADHHHIEYVSSGHYIRKVENDGYYYLQRAVDPVKDQSYFLWEIQSRVIQRMITPLGDYTKKEVRQIAKENGFDDLARQKESMGVCFLKQNDYRQFLKDYIPDKLKKITPGDVVDERGAITGTHQGFVFYTIGQKRDLHLKTNRKAYVSRIDPVNNKLTIGSRSSLYHHHLLLRDIHLINPSMITQRSSMDIVIRGLGLNPTRPAIVKTLSKDALELELPGAAWAVAPGQPVVFYHADILLGGGIAEKSW